MLSLWELTTVPCTKNHTKVGKQVFHAQRWRVHKMRSISANTANLHRVDPYHSAMPNKGTLLPTCCLKGFCLPPGRVLHLTRSLASHLCQRAALCSSQPNWQCPFRKTLSRDFVMQPEHALAHFGPQHRHLHRSSL